MGLRLYLSHRLEQLAAALAGRLAAPGDRATAEARLFQPTAIVIPNLNMKKWLQLTLARRLGAVAHLQFRSFDEEIHAQLQAAAGAAAPQSHLLDLERLRWFVLRAVLGGAGVGGDPADETALTVLRAYVGLPPAGGWALERHQAAKAWQLAGQLARLLRDLELQRGDWTGAWSNPARPTANAGLPPVRTAAAVAALYRLIFTADGLRDRWQVALREQWWTLPGWAEAQAARPLPAGAVDELHIFALPQWSQFHREMLFRLAATRPVQLYCLNLGALPFSQMPPTPTTPWFSPPAVRLCLPDEAWEAGFGPAPAADLQLSAADSAVAAAVRLWNRVGVEGLQLLAAGVPVQPRLETEVCWLDAGRPPVVAAGLLGRVQRRLLDLSAPPAAQPTPAEAAQPATLQVARCPSEARELEAVYHCILQNLARDPTLKQSDILVLVPDMTRYRPVIHAAFDRGDGLLGYNLSDLPGADESVYAQAVAAALQLAEGRLTRAEVFAFLQNPCVAAALSVDRSRLLRWGRWAAALNVFAAEGAEPFTWRQALRRLALGRVMEAPSPRLEEEDPAPPDFYGAIPYADADTADREELDLFIGTLEQLEAGVAALRAAAADAAGWLSALQNFLERFVAVPPEVPAEASVRMAVGEALGRLHSGLQQQGLAGWPQPPRLLLREAVLETLATLQSRQGRYLSGGVTLSTQYPLRPIPFRLVFVVGLDEHNFPTHPRHSALDPRRAARRLGDADESDLQRMMFLEAVLSARDRLYLTYVHRDLQKDEERLPCALLLQLLDLVAPLTVDGLPLVTVPLNSHAPEHWQAAGFARQAGESRAPSDFECNFSPLDRDLAAVVVAREAAGDAVGTAAAPALTAPTGPPRQKPAAAPAVLDVPVSRLARFLQRPLDAALQTHLGLPWREDEAEAVLEAETEPFFLTAAAERVVARATVQGLLAGRPREAAVAQGLARLELQRRLGLTPTGDFHRAEAERLRAELLRAAWAEPDGSGALPAAIAELLPLRYRPAVVFGDGRDVRSAVEQFGALELPAVPPPPGKEASAGLPAIRLHGRLRHAWHAADGRQLHVVVPVDAKKSGGKGLGDLFEAVLLTAALSAARAPGGQVVELAPADPLRHFDSVRLYALYRDSLNAYDLVLAPEMALRALHALIADWAAPGDYTDLPFSLLQTEWATLQEMFAAGGADPVQAAAFQRNLDRELQTAGDTDFGGWTPTPGERLVGARLPVDSAAVALRRFELVLRLSAVDRRAPAPVSAAPAAAPAAPKTAKGGARGTKKRGS